MLSVQERKLKLANYRFITRLGVMIDDAKMKQRNCTEFGKQVVALYRQKLLLKIQNIVRLLINYDFKKVFILVPDMMKSILVHINQLIKIGVTDLQQQRFFFKDVVRNIYDIHKWYNKNKKTT
tara:strand:- start:872 stop:1240 length:369 start_codon:yes stop_codon:yes gene_type:complete